jgi:hypothetical protein
MSELKQRVMGQCPAPSSCGRVCFSVSVNRGPFYLVSTATPPRDGGAFFIYGGMISHLVEMFSGQPEMFSGQPEMFSGQPRKFSGQPRKFSGQPEMFSGQPRKFSGQPEMFSDKLEMKAY